MVLFTHLLDYIATDEVLENPTMSPVKNCKSAKDCPTEVEALTSAPTLNTFITLSPVKNPSATIMESLPTMSPVKNCKSAKDCPDDCKLNVLIFLSVTNIDKLILT